MGDSATDSQPPSRPALAAALGRGDEAGLLAAHDAYGPDLFRYADFLLAGHPDAERADEAAGAVLDALLAATGAVADLVDPERMLPWLLALTRNECLRRARTVLRDQPLVPDTAPSAEEEALRQLEAQAVAAAIAQLPADQRSVLILRDVQGYSGPMVAKALGLTVPAMKSRLHRARSTVRESLGALS